MWEEARYVTPLRPGETHNGRKFQTCSVNLNILTQSLLWFSSSILNVPLQLELKVSESRVLKLEFLLLSLEYSIFCLI
jgi:hypothetical protein